MVLARWSSQVRTKLLLIVSVLLLAFPAFAGRTVKRGPGNQLPGSDASMHEYCRGGGKGIGFNRTEDCYTATCGMYNWSAEHGGVDGDGVSDWDAATTTGGNSWYSICTARPDNYKAAPPTDNAYLVGDGPTADRVEMACEFAGEKVKKFATADALIAQQMTCNGGTVYMSKFDGYPHGIYHFAGCGYDEDGAANECPVLRDHPTTTVKAMHMGLRGIDWVLEGRDGTIPPDRTSGTRKGVYLVDDSGQQLEQCGARGGGCRSEETTAHTDSDGEYLSAQGFLSGLGRNISRACESVSTGDPRCVAITDSNGTFPKTSWGLLGFFYGDSPKHRYNLGQINGCVLNYVGDTYTDSPTATDVTGTSDNNSGTCAENRMIRCTDTTYPCSDGTTDGIRTGANTGGCCFDDDLNGTWETGEEDLGQCEGFATALGTEMAAGRQPVIMVTGNGAPFGEQGGRSRNSDSVQLVVPTAVLSTKCGGPATTSANNETVTGRGLEVEFRDITNTTTGSFHWPFDTHTFSASKENAGGNPVIQSKMQIIDMTENRAGWIKGGTIMPQDYRGRLASDGVTYICEGDIITTGSADNDDCDTTNSISLNGIGGGFDGVDTMLLSSEGHAAINAHMESIWPAYKNANVYNLRVIEGHAFNVRRSVFSNLQIFQPSIYGSSGMFAFCDANNSYMEKIYIHGGLGTAIIHAMPGFACSAEDIISTGWHGDGVLLKIGNQLRFNRLRFQSMTGNPIDVSPQFPIRDVVFSNTMIAGRGNTPEITVGGSRITAAAAISIADVDGTEMIDGLKFENTSITTDAINYCGVFIDAGITTQRSGIEFDGLNVWEYGEAGQVTGNDALTLVTAFNAAAQQGDFNNATRLDLTGGVHADVQAVFKEGGAFGGYWLKLASDPDSCRIPIEYWPSEDRIQFTSPGYTLGAGGCSAAGVSDSIEISHVSTAKAFCTFNSTNTVLEDATDDTGGGNLGNERYKPRSRNVSANGVALADHDYTVMSAADVGDCDATPEAGDVAPGTRVAIHDDGATACADTAGVLDAAGTPGTAYSICECRSDSAWYQP